mmetsp:Transcript_7969/g.8121  ORF Transcript_7969/g.8121 Transcript_7969/m.8121 type:complete len:216 (-) Transcript_7969:210-857(-)|eukprot:CAMPEP_0182431972 /NCGR_PEP_ID=MMETSP1167-20130531/53024_1 /TAXON_ID=2988 /ORGANISM="Mallomonas Sp, Strain CCMP3275" /LENGTH=215 /DNA_ID=CAMNT_0024618939 /DNA_START=74 /DNA_END=721 /DNA_ORIENTATION=-
MRSALGLLLFLSQFLLHKSLKISYKKAFVTAGLLITLSPAVIPDIAHADAMSAAFNAMKETSSRSEGTEKAYDDLAPAAKKRKALSLCKDSSTRDSAGYSSASECTSAVLSGNYDTILLGKGLKLRPTESSSSAVKSLPTMNKIPSATVSSVSSSTRVKQQDLSDLPPAAKKRRALAACKKADFRKSARLGSESKCTQKVFDGDFDDIIEELEYL